MRRHTWLPLLHDSHTLYGIRTDVPIRKTDPHAYPWRPTKVTRERVAELVARGTLTRLAKLPTFKPRLPFEAALVLDCKANAFAAYASESDAWTSDGGEERDLRLLLLALEYTGRDGADLVGPAHASNPVYVSVLRFVQTLPDRKLTLPSPFPWQRS